MNFIQQRSRRAADGRRLLSMTRRVERPIGPFERTRGLVEVLRQIAFVEMLYPPKFVSRAGRELTIGPGNHVVGGLTAPSQPTDSLRCLHAPLRSVAALEAKADRGRRQAAAGWPADLGWHARHFGHMIARGELEAEWQANTYDDAGHLDVFGSTRDTVVDESLRDAVAAVLEAERSRPAIKRLIARLAAGYTNTRPVAEEATPKTGVTLPAGYRSPRCPSSIGRGPRPRPGSSCATAPPSVLEASCGAVAARRHGGSGCRSTSTGWSSFRGPGGQISAESPSRVLDLASPKFLAAWLAEHTASSVVATDLWPVEVERWRRLIRAETHRATAIGGSRLKPRTERRSPTRTRASTPPTASR